MALTNDQKLLIQEWVAAGKTNREIIRLAAEHDPPFEVKGANISKSYRKPVKQKVEKIREEKSEEAIRAGLATKEERIRMLEKTAEYLFERIDKIPLMQLQTVPSYVNAMRGCLDDIAKELGQRNTKVDVNANVRVRDIVKIVEKVYGSGDRGPRNEQRGTSSEVRG